MADTVLTPKSEDSLESRFEELGVKAAKVPSRPPLPPQQTLLLPVDAPLPVETVDAPPVDAPPLDVHVEPATSAQATLIASVASVASTAGDTEIFDSRARIPAARAARLEPEDAIPIVDRTAPFNREAIFAAARTLSATPPPPPVATAGAPTLMGGFAARPPSIAPVAVDVPLRPLVEMTAKLPAIRVKSAPIPRTRPATFRYAMLGAILLGAIVGPVIGWLSVPTPSVKTAAAAAPRQVQTGKIHSAVFEPPETAPLKMASSNREPTPSPNREPEASPSPLTVTQATTAAASPPPAAAPRPSPKSRPTASPAPLPPPAETQAPVAVSPPPPPPAPKPAAPPPTTGVVQVPDAMMTITVDGEYRRVQAGRVVMTCGRHKITAGIKGTQFVDVPCGGVLTL